MCALSLGKPAWFADGSRATPIICALHKPARSAARSVMSSRFRYAGDIIVSSIVTAMKPRGGDPTRAARALWLETHPLGANKFAAVAADPGPSNGVSQ
jgi:hypothetical protein